MTPQFKPILPFKQSSEDENEQLDILKQEIARLNNDITERIHKFNTLLYHCTFYEEDNEKLREIVKSLRAENASLYSRIEFLEIMVSQLKGETPV